MSRYGIFSAVAILWCAFAVSASAQVTTGTISGRVTDSAGAAIPGAEVVVQDQDTGIARTIKADANGHYSALALQVGNYRVTAKATGFGTEIKNGIVLTVGSEAVIDMPLQIGAVSQTVEVTGTQSLVESTTASLGSLVDDRTIRSLPLNGRSYDQLALLQPGVVAEPPNTNTATVFSFGSGKRFSTGGQRDNSNSFLLDGTDINDSANGTPGGASGNNLGVDTIMEFKIFTNSVKAEYGHSSGSVVTSVTRSGTNSFHGTAYEYIRNSVLDARNYFDIGAQPPFRRNQFGAVLGGPIKKDKTFFFVGYEGLRQGQETTQIATVPTAAARQGNLPSGHVTVNPSVVPFLNMYPFPNGTDYGDGTAQFLSAPNVVTNEDYGMVRVDHQLNSKTNLFTRYSIDADNVNNPGSLPDQLLTYGARRQYFTAQATTVVSANTLNNARFAFNRSYEVINNFVSPDPGITLIPGQTFGGVQVGGSGSSGPRAITPLGTPTGNGIYIWPFNVFEEADDFTHVVGKHTLKTGIDIQRIQSNSTNGQSAKGNYTFTSFNTFLAGTPSNLSSLAPVGSPFEAGYRQTLFGVYAQDDYAISPRLTLNLGLRWEAPTDPHEVNGKSAILPSVTSPTMLVSNALISIGKKNFEPRFGLAWLIDGSGKTVIRIGAGIYHQQILPWAYLTEEKVPPFSGLYSITNPSFPDGYLQLPAGNPSATGNGKTSLALMSPVAKTPTDYQYNISIQRQLSAHTVVQVAYAGNHANYLQAQAEQDTPVPTFVNGQPFFAAGAPRQNPAWNGIRQYSMNTNSQYDSGTVTLRQQMYKGFEGQIFYTYSKSLDEQSGVTAAESQRSPGGIMNPLNPKADWAPSDFSAKHVVVGIFSYAFPFTVKDRVLGSIVNHWALHGIGTFLAGQPFTAVLATSVSRNGAVVLAERPNLVPGASQNPIHGVSRGCSGFAGGTPVGNAQHWLDPCSFSLPAAGTYGNLGRNTIVGPGLDELDFALEKNFKIHEQIGWTFRAEAFNIINHPNFGLPNAAPLAASGAASGSAGAITTTSTSSRQLQFAVRIYF